MCTGLEVLMLAGTAVSAASSIQQGKQAKRMGEFNARQAEADAVTERDAAAKRAEKIRRAGRSQQSEARAALAASGVEVAAGTPVRIEREIGRRAERDALEEILFGERRGSSLEGEATLERMAGRNRQRAGQLKAAGSVLSGGAEIARGWRNPYGDGLFT